MRPRWGQLSPQRTAEVGTYLTKGMYYFNIWKVTFIFTPKKAVPEPEPTLQTSDRMINIQRRVNSKR